ncbi:MAG: hypothetical protein H6564_13075 [Lewinellaceae bacterium]|nr:hypothetical protein [Lewinellaceae bacterium]
MSLEVPEARIVERSTITMPRNMSIGGANAPTGGQNAAQCLFAAVQKLAVERNAGLIVEACRAVFKLRKIVNRWLNYLEKHQDKSRYAEFEQAKLMCGSGIIESAIRRVINLRFKNASTFWDKQVVEKLYFLRAALLAKRWDIVMENFTK